MNGYSFSRYFIPDDGRICHEIHIELEMHSLMDMINISLGTAAVIVLLGMAVVFFVLILLMLVTKLTSRFFISREKRNTAQEKEAPPVIAADKAEPAPGSAGELKLYDTDPRDAAMIMAIVADKMGKPLNELRFKSIKEIK